MPPFSKGGRKLLCRGQAEPARMSRVQLCCCVGYAHAYLWQAELAGTSRVQLCGYVGYAHEYLWRRFTGSTVQCRVLRAKNSYHTSARSKVFARLLQKAAGSACRDIKIPAKKAGVFYRFYQKAIAPFQKERHNLGVRHKKSAKREQGGDAPRPLHTETEPPYTTVSPRVAGILYSIPSFLYRGRGKVVCTCLIGRCVMERVSFRNRAFFAALQAERRGGFSLPTRTDAPPARL